MKIVAHGGGNRLPSAKHALDLSGDQNPSVLLIPSSSQSLDKFKRRVGLVESTFRELGVATALLHEFGEEPTKTKIEHEIGRASLLYTIGGNSPHMLKTMHRHETDIAVKDAILDGKVHAGTSAGALLPFELGHSNVSARNAEEEWDFEYLPMLGIVPGVVTAHADQHDETPYGLRPDSRMDALINTFPPHVSHGFAIENGAALVAHDDHPLYVVRANEASNVYRLRRSDDTIDISVLE